MTRQRGLLSLFARVTTSGRFIPEVDGIRFVAIGAVILFHLNGYLGVHLGGRYPDHGSSVVERIAIHGHYGVQLFFVLSGFILALPCARHHLAGAAPVPLKAYYTRRLTRLEPLYLLNLALMAAAAVALGHATASEMAPHLLASALYQHGLVYGGMSTVNGVAWSLEVEVQFYLLVPALTTVFRVGSAVWRRTLIVTAIGVAGLIHCLPDIGSSRLSLTIIYFVGYFLAGFLLADLYIVDWKENPSRNAYWDVAFVVACASAYWAVVRGEQFADVVLPFLCIVSFTALFKGKFARALLVQPAITTVGGMCYTIYLYHFAIISAAGRFATRLPMPESYTMALTTQFLMLGPVVLLGSAVLFRMVEQPCMRRDWVQRLVARLRPGAPIPDAAANERAGSVVDSAS